MAFLVNLFRPPKIATTPLPATPSFEDPAVEKARADELADINRKQSTAALAILAPNTPTTASGANDNRPAVRRLLGEPA